MFKISGTSSHYRTTALIVCELAWKMVQILFFFGPVRFRGHFEEGIAKVLLNTKPRCVGKFQGCRFSDVWESAEREKKENKLSAK